MEPSRWFLDRAIYLLRVFLSSLALIRSCRSGAVRLRATLRVPLPGNQIKALTSASLVSPSAARGSSIGTN